MDKVLRAHLQTLTDRRERLTQEGMERYQQNGNVEDSRCRDIHLHCTRLNEQDRKSVV
jgi:hypothetical protein